MTNMAMDTHRIVKRFKDAGFSEVQAELLTDVVRETANDHLDDVATKGDIKDVRNEIAALKAELKGDIGSLRSELKGEIKEVRNDVSALRSEIKSDNEKLRLEMTVKFGSMLLVAVGIILTAMRFMLPH